MPTIIQPGKTVVRETISTVRGRPLVVILHPKYMVVGTKNCRSDQYMIAYEAVYEAAVKMYVREIRNERV